VILARSRARQFRGQGGRGLALAVITPDHRQLASAASLLLELQTRGWVGGFARSALRVSSLASEMMFETPRVAAISGN